VVESTCQSSSITSAPPQSLCGGFSFSAYGLQRLDDDGAAPALPDMGHLGPRFRARDIAGKIALVYAVALRRMARNKFGVILAEVRFLDRIMLKTTSCPNRTRQGVEQRPVRPRLPAFVGSEFAVDAFPAVFPNFLDHNENKGQ
jgi:hypothetical protein